MLVGLDERNKATQQLMKELTAPPEPASPVLLLRLLHKNLFIVRTKCCNLGTFGYVNLALFRQNDVKCVFCAPRMLNKLV